MPLPWLRQRGLNGIVHAVESGAVTDCHPRGIFRRDAYFESFAQRTTKIRRHLLLAVFFTLVTMGLANDIVSIGRLPQIRFGLSLLISGLSAVCYAVGGITLRSRFWKAFIPLFALHMGLLSFLAHRYPDAPRLRQMNSVETERLEKRLSFDGFATIITVCLG